MSTQEKYKADIIINIISYMYIIVFIITGLFLCWIW